MEFLHKKTALGICTDFGLALELVISLICLLIKLMILYPTFLREFLRQSLAYKIQTILFSLHDLSNPENCKEKNDNHSKN